MTTEFTKEDVESLAAKLDGLELTSAEQAVLGGILERAAMADDEVAGFAFDGKGNDLRARPGASMGWKVEGESWKIEQPSISASRLGDAIGMKLKW